MFYAQSVNQYDYTWARREREKYYIKKSCDADKYRRMAGLTESSCKKEAENIGIVGRVFGMKYR